MLATKYIGAFENFDNTEAPGPVEETPKEIIEKIWEFIDGDKIFSVISSYKPGKAPAVLEKEYEQLKSDLMKMKYGYLDQCYNYHYGDGNGLTQVKRKSLFVPLLPYKELLQLAKKYDQETVAFGNGKLDVVRVKDEAIIKTISFSNLKLAWNFLIADDHNIPW